MPALTSAQRKLLDDACVKGRRAAEQAVRAALSFLSVTAERPPAHLSEDDRRLRRGLRAKVRQLGDVGEKPDLLTAECAFEQWHRLLFARFLAENNLLIHPEYRAPVTLEDCDDLAADLDEPDGWAVAGRFAAEILPGIFRLDDPCVQLRLAPEGRLALEGLVAGLPPEIFSGDDALGWVYQFWQREQKDEVNNSGRKVGGSDLGPVTQLFTENYMVRFLLENSLGAWWASRHPNSRLKSEWEYLRLDANDNPAAGSFDGWPETVAEVTLMDPCCGSGHFLVEAFEMLWRMRVEEAGLQPIEAQDAVLRDNLFGLELDARCVQIAMFAVALTAWKSGGGWRKLPTPHIACSGLATSAGADEWEALAQGEVRLEGALLRLHDLFRNADSLGSLIDPSTASDTSKAGGQSSLEGVDWNEIAPIVERLLESEARDPATAVLGAGASGAARAASLLSQHYTLVCTNPPYLDHKKQSPLLLETLKRRYPLTFRDLAMSMAERAFTLAAPEGAVALVTPSLWASARPFERFRKELLDGAGLELTANLGSGAFESIGGEVVNVVLMVSSVRPPRVGVDLRILDVSDQDTPMLKSHALRRSKIGDLTRTGQARNPMTRFLFVSTESAGFLRDVCIGSAGIQTGDNSRFNRCFWELDEDAIAQGWIRLQRSADKTSPRTGMHQMLLWQQGEGELKRFVQERLGSVNTGAWIRGTELWGQSGVLVSRIGDVPATIYSGEGFADNAVVLVPRQADDFGALWAFCSSSEFAEAVRSVDGRLSVTVGTFLGTPVDLDTWRSRVVEPPSHDLGDPTQWVFGGRPESSIAPLQVGVGRLLGFKWPDQPEDDPLSNLADDDGIACVPSVRGERTAADRLQEVLSRSFSGTWSPARTQELLTASGSKKKDLDSWLRDDFFQAHCLLFKNRPFVWQIWDGRKDGFSALVNYHRLDRPTLEKVTYSYLGDWIERQVAGVRDDVAGAEARVAAARSLQEKLRLILDGEPPHDIHVRWKSLAEQPMGWEPCLRDGVRLNIRPFISASVLRSKVAVHWRPDSGKANDSHFTNAEKRAARGESA